MPRAKYKKRPDGRYQTKVYLGADENGRPKYKYIYAPTITELERKAEEIRYTLHRGTDVFSGDLAFRVWADRFLLLKRGKIADAYYKGLEGRITFWCDAVGDMPLSKITRSDLQVHLDKLAEYNPTRKKPSSHKTLIDYRRTAASVFELAISDRALQFNPAEKLDISEKAERSHRRALTSEEQQWILNTPHRAQTAAMIMMLAGLRRGELIPLQVCDIDLTAGIIRVDKSVSMVNGQPVTKRGGKTAAATRCVEIPNLLVCYLRDKLAGKSPFDLVCTDTKGRLLSEIAFKRMWDSYLLDLNLKYGTFTTKPKSKFQPSGVPMVIPRITPHMLRHTCATNMILAGMDAVTVKEQLGHTDIQTTLNIYTHVTREHRKTQINKLDDFLQSQTG